MGMFALYCDDSGTDNQSPIAVAGAYVATVEQWTEFKRNWDEVNQRESFGVFHMADFVARKEQFKLPEWRDETKRNRTIKALIGAINLRIHFGIAAAVEKAAYDEVVPDDLRSRLGNNHFIFAIRQCMKPIEKWRQKHGYTEPMQYVFDRSSKGHGEMAEINSVFEVLESGGESALAHYGIEPDGWSFQNKTNLVQLQAADIWAYENFRYVRGWYLPKSTEAPRKSYTALLKANVIRRYQNRKTLALLVQDMRELDAGMVKLSSDSL